MHNGEVVLLSTSQHFHARQNHRWKLMQELLRIISYTCRDLIFLLYFYGWKDINDWNQARNSKIKKAVINWNPITQMLMSYNSQASFYLVKPVEKSKLLSFLYHLPEQCESLCSFCESASAVALLMAAWRYLIHLLWPWVSGFLVVLNVLIPVSATLEITCSVGGLSIFFFTLPIFFLIDTATVLSC